MKIAKDFVKLIFKETFGRPVWFYAMTITIYLLVFLDRVFKFQTITQVIDTIAINFTSIYLFGLIVKFAIQEIFKWLSIQ